MDAAGPRSALPRRMIQKLAEPCVLIRPTARAATFAREPGHVDAGRALLVRSPVTRTAASGIASRPPRRGASSLRMCPFSPPDGLMGMREPPPVRPGEALFVSDVRRRARL